MALALSAAAYWSIVRAFFFIDDYGVLYLLRTEPLAGFLFKPWSGHVSALRNAGFALMFQAFGLRPAGYLVIVLLTHLLNVGLLFRVLRLQTSSWGLAFFGASLWGVAPLHAETLAWICVYGHCLVATLLLLVMSQVARVAATDGPIPHAAPLLWATAMVAAALSFAAGLAVAVVSPAAVALMLPPGRLRGRARAMLFGAAIAAPALWVFASTFKLGPDPGGLGDWRSQLATTHLLVKMLQMVAALAVAGVTQLFVAPGDPANGPALLPASVCLITGIGVVLILARAEHPVRRTALGWALLTAGAYGLIAIGRTPLFLALAPDLVLVFPRYQYVASIGVVAILCLAAATISDRWPLSERVRRLAVFAWAAVCAVWLWYVPRPIDLHGEERQKVLGRVEAMQAAIALGRPGADVFLADRRVRLGYAPSDWDSGTFIVFFDDNVVDGRRVRFVAEPERVQAAREDPSSRLARLLVTADEARQGRADP